MLFITLTVKVRQLGHDMTGNADSISATGMLNGRSLGVRSECKDEHTPACLTRKLECGGQRTHTQIG